LQATRNQQLIAEHGQVAVINMMRLGYYDGTFPPLTGGLA
jgi:hypothetical protein